MKYNTIISFGSAQLKEFNLQPGKYKLGEPRLVYIYTVLSDPIARDLMYKTPGIGTGFCTTYDYDSKILEFEENALGYTYEELMLCRKV